MSEGLHWTGERVLARLVVAFREVPGAPVWSSGRARSVRLDPDVVDLILLSTVCLGRDSFPRVQLLTFARAYAAGEPISAVCAVHGWPRSGAYRRVRRAAAAVATCLNERSVRF